MLSSHHLVALLIALLLILPLLGCDSPDPTPPTPQIDRSTISEPDSETSPRAQKTQEAQEAQAPDPRQETAMAAIFDLRDTLLARVMTVARAEGFPAAVAVCYDEAIPLTEEIAQKHGVALGRTSDKLRNPDNNTPSWLSDLTPHASEGPYFTIADSGELRGVAPIRLAEACTHCHGQADKLADGVSAELARLYPNDQATGYAAGDLRGYFWVEVP